MALYDRGMTKRVLIAGASGMVGERVLHYCLESERASEVVVLGRRKLPHQHSKLTQFIHQDFLDLADVEEAFEEIDVCVYCVGAYSGQHSDDEFRKITVGFTESFGRTLAEKSPQAGLVFLSAQGADLTEKSRMAFARYKGRAENVVLNLQFSRLDIFRPGFIYPSRTRVEPSFTYRVFRFLYPALSKLYPNMGLSSDELGWALAEAALNEPIQMEGPIWENQEIRTLAQSRSHWVARRAEPFTDKIFLITGANTGLGFETARMCARGGAHTILACRDADKANLARASLIGEYPDCRVEVVELDLASLESVHRCAEALKQQLDRLDGLVNNAGVMMCPYQTTEEGFEMQMGVNHLGHFALTGQLLPLLKQAPAARVVSVSSMAHRSAEMDFENFLYESDEGYSPLTAYRRSKLANLLFTMELQARLERAGSSVKAVAAHPGVSRTDLARYVETSPITGRFFQLVFRFGQSPVMGAQPQMRALVDREVKGGEYYGPDGFRGMSGFPVLETPRPQALVESDRRQLWEISEELTGVRYAL